MVQVHHFVNLDPIGPDGVLPQDGEVIQERALGDNTTVISRHCFLLLHRHDLTHLYQDHLESLPQRLFDGGSPIPRLGFTYRVTPSLSLQSMFEITRLIIDILEDQQNFGMQTLLFHVVSMHIVILPEDMYEGNHEEARILLESAETAPGLVTRPASREAVESLGRTRVEDGGDCTICLEGLSPTEDHTSMPCKHVFHNACILKWLETSPLCPLCRFSLPQEAQISRK